MLPENQSDSQESKTGFWQGMSWTLVGVIAVGGVLLAAGGWLNWYDAFHNDVPPSSGHDLLFYVLCTVLLILAFVVLNLLNGQIERRK
jgi:hypothetical protein